MLWQIPDIAIVGKSFVLASLVVGENTLIPPITEFVITGGYYETGDNGNATYKRVDAEPSHSGKFQSADGAWWELFSTTINPFIFGAKLSDEDSTNNIQDMVNWAFENSSAGNIIVMDGSNGNFTIEQPIIYPSGEFVKLQNMRLIASNDFPDTSYMIEVLSQDADLCNHDLTFENLVLDANHTGGCLAIDNYIRIDINNCKFLHFSTDGLKLLATLDSHECCVTQCWAFEYLYGEAGYDNPTPTSVGFNVRSFDNSLTDCISYYTGNGMVIAGQYNLITKAHCGGPTNGILIEETGPFNSLVQCYIDVGQLQIINPWNTEIIGCKFLTNTTDANFNFITLKAASPNLAIIGLKIEGCSFHSINATLNPIIVDDSDGNFNAAFIVDCYIKNNSFINCDKKFTEVNDKLFENASTDWVFDLDNYFPFGSVQYAFITAQSNVPAAAFSINSIVNNVVSVKASTANNATVFIKAGINTGITN